MSYPDEADDYRAAEGRSGDGTRRRASRPARPAWDAATYGRPDDMRPPPRRNQPPPEPYPPASSFPADPYPAPDPYPPDSYRSDPYSPPDSYGSDPYPPSDSYRGQPTEAYRAAEPYDPYPAASPYPDPYPAASPYPDADPYPEADPYPGADPFPAPDAYSAKPGSSRYPMTPNFDSDSFAPDRYTSFGTDPGGHETGYGGADEPEPTYVAAGLYLDGEDGGPVAPEPGPSGGWDAPTREPAPPPSGRAGRNLPAAIGVGVGLGAAVILSLFVWRPAFLGVVAAAVGVGIWELVRAIRNSGANPPLIPLIAGGALMTGLAWFGQGDALTFGLVVTVVAVMVWRLADGVGGYARDVTAATLVAVYVPFLGGFAALLAAPADGDVRVVVTLAAVVLSDTGGYIAGVLFGRHPMAPSVSPKKSWEGLVGSLAATAVGSAILLLLLLDVSVWWGLLFGVAVSAASVVGDLGESMVKRDLGVKDMGTLLPGHGGLMDRLDSIVFAAPTAYLLLMVIAPAA